MKFPRATRLVIIFEHETDARRVMEVLPLRMSKYGLTIHPTKSRLLDFQVPKRPASEESDEAPPDKEEPPGSDSFDFLGFSHYWGRSRRGRIVVKRKTSRSRWARTLTRLWEWCRDNRHVHPLVQRAELTQKLRGHFAYYGLADNLRSLHGLLYETHRIWRYWLARRSRGGTMPWANYNRFSQRYPLPRAVLDFPRVRLVASAL